MSNEKFDLDAAINQAKHIATNPVDYFKTMKTSGGFTDPIIFIAVMGAIAGLLASLFTLISLGNFGIVAMGIGSIIIVPIMAIIGCFVSSAFMYIVWKLMGSEQSYECAYRCVSSTMVVMPLMVVLPIIPYIGNVIAVAISFYLIYLATLHVHNISSQKSKIVIGVIAALVIFTNLSGERFQRNVTAKMDGYVKEFNIEGKSPEELGKAMGEFMKGFEEATKENQ
jgi:hypothetical protein